MTRWKVDRRTFVKSVAAAGAALTTSSFTIEASGGTKVLKIRHISDIKTLDPAFWLSRADVDTMAAIMNKLVRFQSTPGKQGWVKEIAESIEQLDDVTIKFTLKKGIPWSNGFGEMSSEDVKYSYERIAGVTGLAADTQFDWGSLKEVEIIDELTGVIHLKEPFAPLWGSTLPNVSGHIVCKKAVEQLPEKRFTTQPPAESGPYRIRTWTPKQRLVLERNPDWPLDPPAFDEIVVLPIDDEKSAELAYLAGEVDMTQIAASSVPSFRDDLPLDTRLLEYPAPSNVWLGQNVDHPALQDIRVRKAIQMAVDVDAVNLAAFFGVAQRATGPLSPGQVGHRGYNLTEHDPDKARALLEEAGAEGLTLRLAALNKAENLTIAQVIQANLAAVGVSVEIDILESGSFWTLGMESEGEQWKDVQLIISGWNQGPDPSWVMQWSVPSQIGIWNWERFNSAEYEDLHLAAVKEMDVEKRHQMYVRMQDLMEESGAYLFFTNGVRAYVHRNTIIPSLTPDGLDFYYRYFKLA